MFLLAPGIGRAQSVAIGGAQFKFSLSPSFVAPYNIKPRAYFIYSANPGSLIADRIHVTNDGNVSGVVTLYAVDAATQQASGTMFLSRTDPKRDVGAWIKLSSTTLSLQPMQSVDVPFTVNVPTRVRAGQHGGGIVAETLNQVRPAVASQSRTLHISMQTLMVLGVLVNLPGTTLEKVGMNKIVYDDKSRFQRLLLGLTNSGTQLLYPSGYVQVFNDHGQMVQNLPITMSTFLPQTSINYPVYIQHNPLPLGKVYTARVSLRYGHNQSLNYSSTFVVSLQSSARFVSLSQNLIASPPATLSALTIVDYLIGMVLLFLILSASFFWGQKLFIPLIKRWRKS